MHVEYVHASKYGNGAAVAQEFERDMASRGVAVAVHHVADADPKQMPPADLYVFSSPGRMGKPIRGMRRFLKDLRLPAGSRFAILTTELAPKPDEQTGEIASEDTCRFQRVRPIMRELLQGKGLVEVAEDKVYVMDVEGPLEDGWQQKVDTFAIRVLGAEAASAGAQEVS